MIINGKKLAFKKQFLLKKKVFQLRKVKKRPPLLISLIAKEDKPGLLYTRLKKKAALKTGVAFKRFSFSLKQKEKIYPLLDKIIKKEVFDGLIIQKPGQSLVNKFFKNKKDFEIWWLTATSKIPEKKDVDCLNVTNLGLFSAGLIRFFPATVKAVYYILLEIFKEEELKGKNVAVIGSSEILGKPLAMLLRDKGCTITWAGSAVKDLKSKTQEAEIIISGVGRPKLITADMVKKGVVVIDAGISKIGKKVVGDVDFKNVAKKAAFITPVPGGVGPLTVISLLENIVEAYEKNRCFNF